MKVSTTSFLQIPTDFSQIASCLDASEFRIFIFLSSICYGNKNVCWPTQETISESTHISLRTAKAKIKSMMEKKIITESGHATSYSNKVDTRQKFYKLASYIEVGKISAKIALDKNCTYISAEFAPTLVQNLHTKKTNSNKTNIRILNSSAGADEGSEATDASEATNSQETREEQLDNQSIDTIDTDEIAVSDWDSAPDNPDYIDRDEPEEKDTRPMEVPDYSNTDIVSVKKKIISYFITNTPSSVYKYKRTFDKIDDVALLRRAAAYLSYWKAHGDGDRSLAMFTTNMEKFVGYVDNLRFQQWTDWEADHQEELKIKFISDNNLFDVKESIPKINAWRASGNKVSFKGMTEGQIKWISENKNFYFLHTGHVKVSQYGYCIENLDELRDDVLKAFFIGAF